MKENKLRKVEVMHHEMLLEMREQVQERDVNDQSELRRRYVMSFFIENTHQFSNGQKWARYTDHDPVFDKLNSWNEHRNLKDIPNLNAPLKMFALKVISTDYVDHALYVSIHYLTSGYVGDIILVCTMRVEVWRNYMRDLLPLKGDKRNSWMTEFM